MQDPMNPQSTRRAGESARRSDSPDGHLSDWQRHTAWIGPVPSNPDPFDEPADSPEIGEIRSDDVRNRTGDFWKDPDDMREPSGLMADPYSVRKHAEEEQRKQDRRIRIRIFWTFLGLLTAAALILYFGVFRITEIRVRGNHDISASEIIRLSGIRRGSSILRLSEKETEQRLNEAAVSAAASENRLEFYRIQFQYLEKEMPGTVILSIREREYCCWLSWCGIIYVMDKSGLVLYESENPANRPSELVEVKGLEIRAGAMAGQRIVLSSDKQEEVFNDLFMQMKVLGCTDIIREADLSNTASILLTTKEGYTVSLGNRKSMHAKLRSMMMVREKLIEMGESGGSINVSNPESPIYSPPAAQ